MYTHKSVRNTREATMRECYERQHTLRCDTAHTKQNAETPHTCRQLHSCMEAYCPTVTPGNHLRTHQAGGLLGHRHSVDVPLLGLDPSHGGAAGATHGLARLHHC